MSGEPLTITDLKISFQTPRGRVNALRGVNLTVPAQSTMSLIGESGSGKSVTGRAVMGLLPRDISRIDGGDIRLNGASVAGWREKQFQEIRGKRVAMVFQNPSRALNPTMRVGKQVAEAITIIDPSASKSQIRTRVMDLFRSVGLPNAVTLFDRYPHELSGGMQQRVAISIALSGNPDLLIADEPTTALDVTTQLQILDLLRTLQRERGMSILLITHDMGVAAHFADHISVMYAGRIVESGSTEELFRDIKMPYTQALLNSVPSMADPTRRLEPIPGGPPDLSQPIVGCPFSPRCKFATDRCRTESPATAVVGSHRYECWNPLGADTDA